MFCVPLSAICFTDKSSGFVIAIVTPSASWGNKIGSRSHKLPALSAEVANSSWVTIAMKDNFSKLSCHYMPLGKGLLFFSKPWVQFCQFFFSPMSINKTQQDLCIRGKLFLIVFTRLLPLMSLITSFQTSTACWWVITSSSSLRKTSVSTRRLNFCHSRSYIPGPLGCAFQWIAGSWELPSRHEHLHLDPEGWPRRSLISVFHWYLRASMNAYWSTMCESWIHSPPHEISLLLTYA